MTSLASVLWLFFSLFYSFRVPFSNVNGNTVAEESRLFLIPERADLISLTISSQTLMHYTVGQQFIAWPRMQVVLGCEWEREAVFAPEIWINVLMSAWHLFCTHTDTYLSFFILCLYGYVFLAHISLWVVTFSVHLHEYTSERLTLICFLTLWSSIEHGQKLKRTMYRDVLQMSSHIFIMCTKVICLILSFGRL